MRRALPDLRGMPPPDREKRASSRGRTIGEQRNRRPPLEALVLVRNRDLGSNVLAVVPGPLSKKIMTEVEELESRIRGLAPDALAQLREWFYEFDNELWDRQIES